MHVCDRTSAMICRIISSSTRAASTRRAIPHPGTHPLQSAAPPPGLVVVVVVLVGGGLLLTLDTPVL